MKKLATALTVLLTVGSSQAFFNGSNMNPWDNNADNRFTSNFGSSDNGIFAQNGYDFWDPRWYSTEFTNMVNEIDSESNDHYAFQSFKDFPVSANQK